MELEHLPLSQVIDEFKEWRTSRKKQSRIPDHLWKHVIPLLTDHPRSRGCCELTFFKKLIDITNWFYKFYF